MKRIKLSLFLFFAALLMLAQEKCTDIIYPADETRPQYNRCILKITHGNLVHYVRNGDTLKIRAVKIIKDDKEVVLYEEKKTKQSFQQYPLPSDFPSAKEYKHDYKYYNKEFEKATIRRNTGVFFTLFGIVSSITGYVLVSIRGGSSKQQKIGKYFLKAGFLTFNIGVPLWISGGIRRTNNKKVVDEMKVNPNITIGFNRNGIGLRINL